MIYQKIVMILNDAKRPYVRVEPPFGRGIGISVEPYKLTGLPTNEVFFFFFFNTNCVVSYN